MEDKTQISVAKGLVELKLLDKRITKTIGQSAFVSVVRGKDKVLAGHQLPGGRGVLLENAEKGFKSNLQSVKDLMERRNAIKATIVASNAVTKVKIGNGTYTVAEAIERKNSIKYDKALLAQMRGQLAGANNFIDRENAKVEDKLQELLKPFQDGEGKNEITIEETTKTYREINEYMLFDPLNLKQAIEKLDETIDAFEAEVDTALSESNAITMLEV